jgi:uncharacterized protein YuzB (UPF0349 family)
MANRGQIMQVDDKGFLINPANKEHITPQYQAVIDDAIQAYRDNIGDDVHSIYVMGSVPRGEAIDGQADLDMFAVLEYYIEPELVMQDWIPQAEQAIADKHDCVTHVELDVWVHGWLLHDPSEFSISAFILRTQAVCVWGADMSPDVTAYQFTRRATRLAIANHDIVQIDWEISETLDELVSDDSAETVRYLCKHTCKSIIHALFGLVMVDVVVHTRDIAASVPYILKHYPDQSAQIQQAVAFIESPTDSAQMLIDFLNTFGAWLIAECDAWLDVHNPERYLEYQFEVDENA